MDKVNTLNSKVISVGHEKLICDVGGFAKCGVSQTGTAGVIIFLPISTPEKLIDLIEVK